MSTLQNRIIPELIIGKSYYICFELPIVRHCTLIDVFDSRFGVYIYVLTDEGTNTIRPYCIGKTKKEAIENIVVENSYSPKFIDLQIKRPYTNL